MGEPSGTDDGRRKLIGFAVRLTGDLSNQFEVKYKGKFRKSEAWKAAKNGAICGTEKDGGQAIENISIEIIKR